MQMVVDVADFTPSQADQLRRAMGSKRSTQKMLELSDALFEGMAAHGIVGRRPTESTASCSPSPTTASPSPTPTPSRPSTRART